MICPFQGAVQEPNIYTSFGYYDQDGIIENSNFKRFSFRGNLDQKINDKLTANISLSLQQSNYFSSNYSFADFGGVPFQTMVMPPTVGIYDAAGKYTVFQWSTLGANQSLWHGQRRVETFTSLYGLLAMWR